MDFFDVIHSRKSIRAFLRKDIDPQDLQKILNAANKAPSAGNLQGYDVFIIRTPATKKLLVDASHGQEYIAQAPIALLFCANPLRSAVKYRERGRKLYCIQDATIACTYAQLAATALGLATVWVGAFNDDAVRVALNLTETLIPVALLPIGYPAENPAFQARRDLSDLVHEVD